MEHRGQRGFGIVELIIIVAVLTLLGVGGWYVWQAVNPNSDNSQETQPPQGNGSNQSLYAGWKTYSDAVGKFTVQHPSDWKIEPWHGTQGGDPITDAKLISPKGTVLKLAANYGGKGGGQCDPAPGDKPFQVGNKCFSWEIVWAERLPIDVDAYVQDGSIEKNNVFAVAQRAVSGEGKPTLTLGLVARNTETIKLDEPLMGSPPFLFISQTQNTPYIEIYATSQDAGFFESEDGKTVKNILHSFKM